MSVASPHWSAGTPIPPPPQKSVTFPKPPKPEIVHLPTLFTIPDWRRAAQSFASPHGRAPHIGDWAPLVDVSVSWPKAQMKSPGQTRQAEDPVSRDKKNSDLREIHILMISSNCVTVAFLMAVSISFVESPSRASMSWSVWPKMSWKM